MFIMSWTLEVLESTQPYRSTKKSIFITGALLRQQTPLSEVPGAYLLLEPLEGHRLFVRLLVQGLMKHFLLQWNRSCLFFRGLSGVHRAIKIL